jgi:hypothetical protein
MDLGLALEAESYVARKLRHLRRKERHPNESSRREKKRIASRTPPRCRFAEVMCERLGNANQHDCAPESSHRPARVLSKEESRSLMEKAQEVSSRVVAWNPRLARADEDVHISTKLIDRIVMNNLVHNLPGLAGDMVETNLPMRENRFSINTGRGRLSATADRFVHKKIVLHEIVYTISPSMNVDNSRKTLAFARKFAWISRKCFHLLV